MAGRAEHIASRPKARRSRPTVKLCLERLDERILPSASPLVVAPPPANVFVWNPQAGSTSASLSQNWQLNGAQEGANQLIPGSQATDQVVFNGALNNNNGNSAITWDGANAWKFASISLGATNAMGQPIAGTQYTNTQTITAPGVELTGSSGTSLFTPLPASYLNLNFRNPNVFKVDAGATLTNMVLSGNQNAQFQLWGSTNIAGLNPNGKYQDSIGVTLFVEPSGKLYDNGYNPLTFTNSDLTLVDEGNLTLYFSYGAGNLLINQATGLTGCWISVNGGTLTYNAEPGITDNLAVPVLVQDGGTFAVTAFNTQNPGGKLVVQGSLPSSGYSVVLTGSASSVQLSGGTTLEADNGYYQDSGILETMDLTTCTLQVGAKSDGTANILGGDLIPGGLNPGLFGDLVVNCGALNFGGIYMPTIAGETTGLTSTLTVNGTMTIEDTAELFVRVYGPLTAGNQWTIITASNQLQPFDPDFTNEKELGLHEKVNQPNQGMYVLSY
jgi:hypothetical protein